MAEYCDFLQGVCVLQAALDTYVTTGAFYNPELKELVKNAGGVKFVPYDAQADETAKTLITFQRGPISLTSKGSLSSSITSNTFAPNISLIIKVSAQSYYLAEKLGQDLLQYIASIKGGIRSFNLNIGDISLSETTNNREASPNYFVNTLTMHASIPLTMWQTQTSDDILLSIKTNITFNEQKILD